MELIFSLLVIRNVEKKDCDVPLKLKKPRLNVEFQRLNSGKHRNQANANKQIYRSYLFVRARRLQMLVT